MFLVKLVLFDRFRENAYMSFLIIQFSPTLLAYLPVLKRLVKLAEGNIRAF